MKANRIVALWVVGLFLTLAKGQEAKQKTGLLATKVAKQGLHNVFVSGISMRDSKALFPDHQKTGPFPTLGYEYEELNFHQWEGRIKMNFELLGDITYYLLGFMANASIEDVDSRFSNTSYFTGGLIELLATWNVYAHDKFTIGAGGVLYDLMYQHRNIDALGVQSNDEFSKASGYGVYGGWAIHSDVLLHRSATLHLDFFRGYGLYHYRTSWLKEQGKAATPFDTWKLTAKIVHETGIFIDVRYHQALAKTDFPTQASRFQFSIGYRIGMHNYDGSTHRRRPN
ncbi:MAG: hypothetical protein LAT76_03445 [Schleiferiaceae bacterium]|nr:hypothetical protein [Schleiferiaceae bacterium]